MLKSRHVHPLVMKLDALHAKAASLFSACLMWELHLTSGAQHSMPWQAIRRFCSQKARNSPVVLRIASGGSNLSIGADLSRRYGQDDAAECFVAQIVRLGAVPQDCSFLPRDFWKIVARRT